MTMMTISAQSLCCKDFQPSHEIFLLTKLMPTCHTMMRLHTHINNLMTTDDYLHPHCAITPYFPSLQLYPVIAPVPHKCEEYTPPRHCEGTK